MKRFLLITVGSIFLIFLILFMYNSNKKSDINKIQTSKLNNIKKENIDMKELSITPISHATMVLTLVGQTIYTDPTGGTNAFAGQDVPDIILITDIHGDHFDPQTLKEISKNNTVLVMPQKVKDQLKEKIPGTIRVMRNGERIEQNGVNIEAIPMYNIPETQDTYHTKGRGNGYVIEGEGKRIYIAGDTGNTPEMRNLKNIDIAFVPMNLPYTMSVEEAAKAVLSFKPKVVHPYHYREPSGFADIEKFKKLVNDSDPSIKIELLNFYPGQ